MTTRAPSAPPELAAIAAVVDARLGRLFDHESARWSAVDPDLEAFVGELARFCARGGKRLRPAFCHWAFLGAGGDPDDPALVELCAVLELLHAFALIHDDVMDGSATRRGHDTVHVTFAAQHRREGWRGEDRRFGEGVAVLLGDLAFGYADVVAAALPAGVRALLAELRLELTMGQYLDLQSAARGDVGVDRAQRVLLYKSAKYTVERPLHLGVALAGGDAGLAAGLSAYGLPVGEAFQLRDDVLGAFGDEAATGKPVGDDLREGKATPLLTLAVAAASPAQAAVLAAVGDPGLDAGGVARIREVLEATGARATVEARIEVLTTEAVAALDRLDLAGGAGPALAGLATYLAARPG